MVECGCKIEEKVKAIQREIKKNIEGANSERKETGTQLNDLEQKGERNIQPEKNMKRQEFQKMRRGLGTTGATLSFPISKSWKCWKEVEVEGREEEEEGQNARCTG